MAGGDGGLQVIAGTFDPGHRAFEAGHAAGDQRAVPKRAVLLGQAQQAAVGIDAGRQTRGLKRHQGGERIDPTLVRQVAGQDQRGDAQGFVAEMAAHQVVADMGGIAFVEQQVDNLQDAVEAGGEVGPGRRLERDRAVADFGLGAGDGLSQGFLAGQHGPGDLARAQPADDLQGQGDALARLQVRVAADEHHGQRVVVQRIGADRLDGGVGIELLGDGRGLACLHGAAAERVDRLIAGDPQQPAGGVVGQALERPGVDRFHAGGLQRAFDQVQVGGAEAAGQHQREVAPVVSVDAVEAGVDRGAGRRREPARHRGRYWPPPAMGRTSTEPP